MKRTILSTLGLAPAMLLAALLAPASAAAAGPVTTADSCSSTGPAAVTCDLWAKPGTLALPGTTVAAWGYSTTAGGAPSFPGPAIVVTSGDTLTLNLTNSLAQPTSLVVQGLADVPDLTSVAAGATHAYTIHANTPGTYLYEAGITPGSEYQVSMGLYGTLIVRPALLPGQAYAAAETAFADEALVVVSEIDPALTGTAATPNPAPQSFDLRNFAPRYFLVNGVAYTSAGAASIPVTAGNALLLRYANAGILHRSLGVLGLHQRVLAADGSQLPAQRTMVAETIAPGQTADVLVTLPPTTAAHTLYPVYDASLALNNSTASGIGGMLAFLDATGTVSGTDNVGPLTSAVSFTQSTGTLAATVSDVSTGNANVTAAEYFIDTPGANGSGSAMSGTFGSPTVAVSATIAGLPSGAHAIYVHGLDANGNWGALVSTTFTIDTTGPTTSALTLTPNPANGLGTVALGAKASDVASGNSNVTAAEYTIDGGAAAAMNLDTVAPTANLSATIPAATINGLSEGPHTVAVRSKDLADNWGASVTITLTIDKTGPVASSLAANPPATNGSFGQSSSNPSVRLTASITDAATGGATIKAAEGFIGSAGANGTGFPLTAVDGVFNASTEAVYADIPLNTLNLLPAGNTTLFVHGKDALGNWGAPASMVYLIDRTVPTFSGITLAAINPTLGGGITLTVNGAVDPLAGVPPLASGIAGGEYWIDTTVTTTGTGTTFSGIGPVAIAPTITTGNHTVRVRVRDAAGNWATNTAIGTVSTTAVAIFSNGFDTGFRPWGWSSASTNSTARLNVTTTTVLSGTRSLQAQGNNTNYVQFNFGTTANPAWPTYDARFQFRPNGNASTGQDILVAASNTNYTAANVRARVRYRLNGSTPEVQIQVGSANTNAAWVSLATGTNTIEIVYQAVGSVGAAPGTLSLYVNGAAAPAQTLTTASTANVTTARLGSVTSGGSSILEYFDAFASKRSVTPYGS